jgi:hypothetical protein
MSHLLRVDEFLELFYHKFTFFLWNILPGDAFLGYDAGRNAGLNQKPALSK